MSLSVSACGVSEQTQDMDSSDVVQERRADGQNQMIEDNAERNTDSDAAGIVVTEEELYGNLESEEYQGRIITDRDGFMFQLSAEPMESGTFSGPVYVSSILESGNTAGAPELTGIQWFERISDEEYGMLSDTH